MPQQVLVVDDEPYMHVLLNHHLQRAGWQMLKGMNGSEAIEVANRDHPAVIIMDVMMDVMDGLTALKRLKQEATTRDIPVIMITANALNVTREEAEKSGAALFLTKPFSPTQLMLEIRKLLPPAPATAS